MVFRKKVRIVPICDFVWFLSLFVIALEFVILGLVPGIHFASWCGAAVDVMWWRMHTLSTSEPVDTWITGTSPVMTL